MKIIGIMGPGERDASPAELKLAEEVGAMVARLGFATLTGGMKGVMEFASKGAKGANGLTIGLGPTREKSDMNDYVDIKIPTQMGAGRNYTNILASDALIFVGIGSPGTLSELAFALQVGRPVFILNAPRHACEFLSMYTHPVTYVETADELTSYLEALT